MPENNAINDAPSSVRRSKYEKASEASRLIIDSLEREIKLFVPDLTRADSPNITTFGAPGYSKFVFAYPTTRKSTVTIYFIGSVDVPTPVVPGMPPLRTRPKFANSRTTLTPYYSIIEAPAQVKPLARFLFEYSVPLARSKSKSNPSRTELFTLPEEVPDVNYWEGHSSRILVNRYERDTDARNACIHFHGTSCCACGVNLESVYGQIAKGFVHVHHLELLSAKTRKCAVNPKTDLVPLCPNCHAVAHLRTPPLTPEEIRQLLGVQCHSTQG